MIVTGFLVWKYCYGLLRIISGTPDDECPGDSNGGRSGLRGIDQGGFERRAREEVELNLWLSHRLLSSSGWRTPEGFSATESEERRRGSITYNFQTKVIASLLPRLIYKIVLVL